MTVMTLMSPATIIRYEKLPSDLISLTQVVQQKWNFCECCLGDAFVKLETHLPNCVQNNSISGVLPSVVTWYNNSRMLIFFPKVFIYKSRHNFHRHFQTTFFSPRSKFVLVSTVLFSIKGQSRDEGNEAGWFLHSCVL